MSLPATWKEWGEALAAFVPGPILIILSQWQGLFANTVFGHRDWLDKIPKAVSGFSVLVAIAVVLFFFDKPDSRKRAAVWNALVGSIAGLVVCLALNYLILPLQTTVAGISFVIELWAAVYFLAMLFIAAFVSLFVLFAMRRKGSTP
jgi:hypothetical protein